MQHATTAMLRHTFMVWAICYHITTTPGMRHACGRQLQQLTTIGGTHLAPKLKPQRSPIDRLAAGK